MFLEEEIDSADRQTLLNWLDAPTYYDLHREKNYRYLQPKIIVEPFFGEDVSIVPADYKVYCFHGIARFLLLSTGRFGKQRESFYDVDWNRLQFSRGQQPHEEDAPRPQALTKIVAISQTLSRRFDFIRVDCYASGDDVRVGELTNLPAGANKPIRPLKEELRLGKYFEGS